jgi:transcriptional regulator with XRE-family HTH domain
MKKNELARHLGVSTSVVSDWCNGNKNPRTDKIVAMAELFNVRYSDLTDDPVGKMTLDEEKIISKYLGNNKDMGRIVAVCKKMPPDKLEHLADFLEAK